MEKKRFGYRRIPRLLLPAALTLCMLLPAASCGGTVPETPAASGSGELDETSESEPLLSEETDSKETADETPPEDQAVVSPLAVSDFMEPVSQNSWARPDGWNDPESENALSFVMIHFSSDLSGLPDNPYDPERIRKIYFDSGASTHYLIDREGRILCFVPENRAAWHAGKGNWKGDEKLKDRMNLYSVGIEIMAMGSKRDMALYMTGEEYDAVPAEWVGYTDAQYDALRALLRDICGRYGIPADRDHVIGHEEYAPDRKRDPGELFDWERALS